MMRKGGRLWVVGRGTGKYTTLLSSMYGKLTILGILVVPANSLA